MRKILSIMTAAAGFALVALPGCTTEVSEEQVASPQEDEEAKAEMEREMQEMQEEMQRQMPQGGRR